MKISNNLYSRLLLVMDGRYAGSSGFFEAVEMARQLSASMHVMVIAQNLLDSVSQIQSEALVYEYSVRCGSPLDADPVILERVLSYASEVGVAVTGEIVNVADPVDDVLKSAQMCNSDAILVEGRLRQRMSDFFVGSFSDRLIKVAKVPVVFLSLVDRSTPPRI